MGRRAVLIGLISAMWWLTAAAPAPAAERVATVWPVGVTPAPPAPMARAPLAAAAVLPDGDLFLVGGGRMGPDVSEPDGHGDAARFDFATKRWRGLAPAPSRITNADAVAVGAHVVVVGIRPRCIDNNGQIECRGGYLRAAVYDAPGDSWRAVRLPARYRDLTVGASGLVAVSGGAYFSMMGDIVRIEPSGEVWTVARDVRLPSDGCIAGGRVAGASLRSIAAGAAPTIELVDPTDGSIESVAAPDLGVTPGSRVVCSGTTVVFVPPFDPTTPLAAYDVARASWFTIPPPPLPVDVQRCAPNRPPPDCDAPHWSGHGGSFDAWFATRVPGARYDFERATWSSIEPGPDTTFGSALGATDAILWSGGLGAAFVFDDSGAGTELDRELVVYRPS